MQSGISSVQRGLLDTLIGIGLVSAGASALNQALERTSDAKMKRTADRPIAAGRISLVQGILAGIGALALGGWWLLLHTNLLTVSLALLTAFLLRRDLHAAQTRHLACDLHRRISRSHGPDARLDRRPRTH